MTYVYSNAGPTSITETLTSTQNRTTSIAYNALGLPETLTDARGKATTLGYNGSGQLTTVTDPLGHETLFGYDAMGRISLVTDALTHATATSYDARGRVTRITNHDGTYSTFTYDKSGRRTQARDALGKVTYSIYDPLGRLARVVDPMNGATRYEYDVMSRLVALTDAKQQRTAFEYFPNGRLKKTTYPGGAFESSTYDAAGRLATKTDGKLVTTSYSYDALNRLEGVTYSDGVTPAVSYTYHPAGQVATAANGTDTLTWTYDLAGRLLTEQSSKNASTVAYTHDAGSNRLTASLDGALFVSHGYDDASRLTTITRGSNVVGFGYDNANRRTSMTHPNGVNTSYSYDNLNRLLNLSAVHTPTSTTITNFTYTYDAAGNRVTKQQPDHVESYGYDGLYRLTRAERTGGLTGLGTYTYDTVGNRLGAQQDSTVTSSTYNSENQLVSQSGGGSILWRGSLDEPGTVSFTSALVSKPAGMLPGNVFEALLPMSTGSTTVTLQAKDTSNNAMTKQYSVEVTGDAASYRYDPNGNLCSVGGADCSSGSRRYEWSARNELVRVLDNGIETARFKYDTLGRRVEKVAGNITTTWAYAGADILRETISDGTTTTYRYVHGPGIDEPLAREDASTGALQYYHADGLGSIVKVTDQAGAMTLTRRYDAWGNVEIGAGLPGYAFTGREWDPETSLYYYRARHYDPKAGRFISQDPIRFAGGLNLYGYVENDPVALVDPIGLWGFGFTGTVSGEAGLGSGVAGQAGFGGGVFGRGFKELGFGAFTTDGWWAGTPTGPGVGSPSAQAAGVYGASVSAGGAFFGTNANSVCDLKGPFHTGNLTIGLGPISLGLQVSIGTNDAGETILALSAGPPGSGGSKGLSWSWYQTNTTVRGKW
jgi:RHS repeat-associated protein